MLRARTAAVHRRVDSAFGGFDLKQRDAYVSFLQAHGRVLPAIEVVLGRRDLPAWRRRTGCLASDLAEFGHHLPAPLAVTGASGTAECFGLLYVIEGSRFGGRLLSRRVAPGFPVRYLAAIHRPGEWQAFVEALEARAAAEDDQWREGAVAGALHGFQLYLAAVEATGFTGGRRNSAPGSWLHRAPGRPSS